MVSAMTKIRPPQNPSEGGVLRTGEHVLRVVRLVSERGTITVREVAAELNVGASTAHRLLATCRAAGFVVQVRHHGPYTGGPALEEIALSAKGALTLQQASDQVLRELRAELGETVGLQVLEGPLVRIVESIEGQQHRVRVVSRIGILLPAHCSAGGKALLACLSDEEVSSRLPGPRLETLTEKSISNLSDLNDELDRIRRRGWAATFGEADTALAGVGAAIRTGTGRPRAAVIATVPLSRMATSGEVSVVAESVVAASARIQRRLRGAVDDKGPT